MPEGGGAIAPTPERALRSAKTRAVGTMIPGFTRIIESCGKAGVRVTRSPRLSIQQGREKTQAGTSDPRLAAIDSISAFDFSKPHKMLRARNVAAASAEPPPSPAATGRF